MSNAIYIQHGFRDRDDYLTCMAEDYGVDLDVVKAIAETLGPSEDFDALVVMLQDSSIGDW